MIVLDLEALNEDAVSTAKRLGAEDAIALTARVRDRMIRFANSSVTTANHVEEAELMVYLTKNKKRAIASTSNLESSSVKRFVRDLFDSLKGLPESEYVSLPDRASKYSPSTLGFDRKLV